MGNKNKVMVFLFLCCAGIMILPFIASCGKSDSVSPSQSKIQMQVVNLSPDLQPINLLVGYIKQNNTPFSYPNPSGYFSLNNLDTPIQIRSYSPLISSTNFVSFNTALKSNFKYTLFVTGLRHDSTVTSIFTVDTSATPSAGRGRVRFVNASPRSGAFDVTANDTIAFRNRAYKSVSPFVEMPAGTYDFKIRPANSSTVIQTLQSVTIVNGKVYTLYCRGIANGADSVAFGVGILNNR
ncbi:MAG: DUF4397 domain-containing protein [Mucilaginibacter sp.]|nr:DUF4397 domain-containing protein [Mucilaginibacter sp.]